MNKILVIDPGKGWGHFVSKMYCYKKLAETLDSKIIFLTKKSTQAKNYLNLSSFCEEVIYLEENKKGLKSVLLNIYIFFQNIKKINNCSFKTCFVFHPSLRYLLIAKFSKATDIWGLGLKYQNFFLHRNKKLYKNFFSKTIENDNEGFEFVKKITGLQNFNYKPFYSYDFNKRDTVGIIIAASGFEKRWNTNNYIDIIEYLYSKGYKNFLIISGLDQKEEEEIIEKKISENLNVTYSSEKNIDEVLPYLKKCIFCIGNDTGFAHLSVNLDIKTLIIYGDCPPQNYSDLIVHIDIEDSLKRSSSSIHSISIEKVIKKLSNFLTYKKN